mgnify:CR=1 FL=1
MQVFLQSDGGNVTDFSGFIRHLKGEQIVDFRRNICNYSTMNISNEQVEIVDQYRYVGVIIDSNKCSSACSGTRDC